MMGDYTYAQTAFGALGEDGAARSAAWLAGDWAALGEGEDALAAAAELVGSGREIHRSFKKSGPCKVSCFSQDVCCCAVTRGVITPSYPG